MKEILFLATLATFSSLSLAATDKVICFYGSWAVYRSGNGKFDVEDINTDLCTHVIYTYLGLNTDGTIKIMDTWNEIDLRAIERFVNLRLRNPNIKLMIAIGGWNEGSSKFSSMVNNVALRNTFVSEVVNFLKKYNLDGFVLDWQYPTERGGVASDRAAFISLLQELRPHFDQNGWLLAAVVAACHPIFYNVPQLSKYLDFIIIMACDLHGPWDAVTGQNAPLFASSHDVTATAKLLNVNTVITNWIASGADPSKIVLGMCTYGRSFTLANSLVNGLGAPAPNAGNGGPYTSENGFLGYNEICEKLKLGWTVVWDEQQKVPYAYSGNQWVGYDNVKSITLKAQYALDKKLGGAMIWSIETDDHKDSCGEGKFPILQGINNVFRLSSSSSGNTTTGGGVIVTEDTKTTITVIPPSNTITGDVCQAAGYVRDPINCNIFYICQKTSTGFTASKFSCGGSLAFDTTLNVCNYASQVTC